MDIISPLTRLRCPPVNHPGKKTFPSILDKLNIHGPNGTHTCYVTTPAILSQALACPVQKLVHGLAYFSLT